MKKVLFLANIPSPYRVDFFNEWGKTCELTVAFERRDAKNRESTWLDSNVQNFKAVYLSGIKYGSDSGICLEIISLVKHNEFDFIIIGVYSEATAILLIEYLNMHRKRYIISLDGAIRHEEKIYMRLLKRHLFRRAVSFLSTGEECDAYIRYYNSNAKIIRYPFSSILRADIIDSAISRAEKELLRKNLGIKSKYMVLSVGQFIPRKGMDTLIKSAGLLDDNICIYIVGGEPTDEYKKLRDQNKKDNVMFMGFKTKEQLAELYKASDVFVLATREDIWGLVVNEAMAYGLPVITTNNCLAGLELVENGKNGYIINVNDIESLSEKIRDVIYSSNYTEMQQECLKTIRQYTIEEMAETHQRLIDQLI